MSCAVPEMSELVSIRHAPIWLVKLSNRSPSAWYAAGEPQRCSSRPLITPAASVTAMTDPASTRPLHFERNLKKIIELSAQLFVGCRKNLTIESELHCPLERGTRQFRLSSHSMGGGKMEPIPSVVATGIYSFRQHGHRLAGFPL